MINPLEFYRGPVIFCGLVCAIIGGIYFLITKYQQNILYVVGTIVAIVIVIIIGIAYCIKKRRDDKWI